MMVVVDGAVIIDVCTDFLKCVFVYSASVCHIKAVIFTVWCVLASRTTEFCSSLV